MFVSINLRFVCAQSLSPVWFFVTPGIVACQAPLSTAASRSNANFLKSVCFLCLFHSYNFSSFLSFFFPAFDLSFHLYSLHTFSTVLSRTADTNARTRQRSKVTQEENCACSHKTWALVLAPPTCWCDPDGVIRSLWIQFLISKRGDATR